jgi:hypothetical protein
VPTNYTLTFWSEDWSGNVEPQKSVSFSFNVGSATGTIRLVWGNSETEGSPCPDAESYWSIGLVGSNKVLKSGAGICPSWSGVNDIAVPVNTNGI